MKSIFRIGIFISACALLTLLLPFNPAQAETSTLHLPATGTPIDLLDGDNQCPIFSDIAEAKQAAEDANDWELFDQLSELYWTLCPYNVVNIDNHPTMGSASTPLGTFTNPVEEIDGQNSAAYAGLYQLTNINQIPTEATICNVTSVFEFTPTQDSDFNNEEYISWRANPYLPENIDPNTTEPDANLSSIQEDNGGELTGTDFGMTIYDGTHRIASTAAGPGAFVPGTNNSVVAGAYNQPAVGSARTIEMTPTTMPTRTQLENWQIGILLQQDSYGAERFDDNWIPTHWTWNIDNQQWEADQFDPSPQQGLTDTVTINKLGVDVTYSINGNCDDTPPVPTNLTNPETGLPVTLATPAGTTITCSSTTREATNSQQDGNYIYPVGLVNFCVNTPHTNNDVSLTFVTDLKPDQVAVRKYNTNNNTYFDIQGATITETTLENQHALKVAYTITDNGYLDLDPAVGSIKDPVGIAIANNTVTGTLPNTGASTTQNVLYSIALIAAGLILAVTFRPHYLRRI